MLFVLCMFLWILSCTLRMTHVCYIWWFLIKILLPECHPCDSVKMRNSFVFFVVASWPLHLIFSCINYTLCSSCCHCDLNPTKVLRFLISTFLSVHLYFFPCCRSRTDMKRVLLLLWQSHPKADNPKNKLNRIQQHLAVVSFPNKIQWMFGLSTERKSKLSRHLKEIRSCCFMTARINVIFVSNPRYSLRKELFLPI